MRFISWTCDGPCKKRVENHANIPPTWHEITIDGEHVGSVCDECQKTTTVATLITAHQAARATLYTAHQADSGHGK